MFDNAEREKRCSYVAVLVHVDFFFPFQNDRAMTSEVRHERACTSFWTRVYCSKLSADREPEEKMKCTDTSGGRYL